MKSFARVTSVCVCVDLHVSYVSSRTPAYASCILQCLNSGFPGQEADELQTAHTNTSRMHCTILIYSDFLSISKQNSQHKLQYKIQNSGKTMKSKKKSDFSLKI